MELCFSVYRSVDLTGDVLQDGPTISEPLLFKSNNSFEIEQQIVAFSC